MPQVKADCITWIAQVQHDKQPMFALCIFSMKKPLIGGDPGVATLLTLRLNTLHFL